MTSQLMGYFTSPILHILWLLVVLSIVVFFHELGHFLVARWYGVKVTAFSIGFGREIWSRVDSHGTRWRIAWIPLGGYVKFMDDDNGASLPSEDALAKLTPEERAGAFHLKPLYQRAWIVAAGPIANLLLAIVLYFFVFAAIGSFTMPATIDETLPGSPAANAGLKAGDQIREVDGSTIRTFSDMQRIVSVSAGKPLAFLIDRDGKRIELAITPELKEIKDPIGNKLQIGVIGVKRSTTAGGAEFKRHGAIESAEMAVRETAFIAYQTVMMLPKLPAAIMRSLSGQQSGLGGPVAIAEMSKQAAEAGIGPLIAFIAFFSISIGILNLMPIPILDGGHLVMYGLEAIRGKALGQANQELSFKIGLALIGTLMFAALFSDVLRKFGIG